MIALIKPPYPHHSAFDVLAVLRSHLYPFQRSAHRPCQNNGID